ncbi:hypothetical protein K2173_009309 [Erythroxylum novogranatense]|uniref:Uncharacterized protein n=1 Tax=Erythroxylum novogranatense TaxID=1862640 RepID=A0AAV8U3T8_9ROSI|nr:hypothetical protein K2173_009309 [Erythroxylum novogranatense]
MDGLIPMVFKAMKKNKVRRDYQFLSSGSAQSYKNSDFHVNSDQLYTNPSQSAENYTVADRKFQHRHLSVEEFTYGDYKRSRSTVMGASSSPQNQLVRFRSQRMFSSTSGA